jgi:hypothetical protein
MLRVTYAGYRYADCCHADIVVNETCGLYYKTITIIIMTIISDAPNCGVTYDRN